MDEKVTHLKLKSPAKINLGLKVLRKREDGFHELETLFQMVALYDDIELELRPSGIELAGHAPGIPLDASNLAWRAANLLLQQVPAGSRQGVRIRLTKRIPAGAGLGGGSGNAAMVLLGLNVLWDLKMPREILLSLAAELGSDVPFFLTSPAAIGRGRGEILESVQPSEKFYVLLVFPGFSIATAWVYQNLNLKLTKGENNISILHKFLSESRIADLGTSLFNDLEPIVIERYSVIQVIKQALLALGAKGVLLSGSGSTVFGLFDNPEQAKIAYAKYESGDGGLFLAETVTRFSEFLPREMLSYP
ncbi:MAG: 4-(cytidine 5'-diphospho)-2-C-methyl-D-erythritol kinase [Nitrospinaceae bacterium]|nr:MAG: 4-(cytidine 5'-diphospho)-2-C-methyl-D-erythritol kinase [Nitrospinaceae bacterium]